VASVNERFSQAIRCRLNGGHDAAFPESGGCCTPAHAQQANVIEETVSSAAAEALDVPYTASIAGRKVSPEFLAKIPIAYARREALVGLTGSDGSMDVALADVAQWSQVQVVGKVLGKPVQPVLAPREEILRAINEAYQTQDGQAQKAIEEFDPATVLEDLERAASSSEDLLDVAGRAPVIRLVNLMMLEAVKRRASDVHVQPYESRLVVRFRVDGVLHDVFEPPKTLQDEVLSRIKVMGGMNIAERRLAQDGRATVQVGDRVVDLRISTLPTSFGERAVLRLLDKSVRVYELERLGMPPKVLEDFRRMIHLDHGIILVTGPTGSGKTTTLYSALQELNSQELNILTLEDPIEYRLSNISQTQVSEKKGMTFASGLRHVLRQDPDIIMVGEIRDSETARMAIQSALTGHLVFSTLHTNDAAGAVTRLLDLGIEPYLVASSLLAVQAQRLVRQICPDCRVECRPTAVELARWGATEEQIQGRSLFRGRGCPSCMQTGYRDRLGIFELLVITEPIRELILQRAKSSSIKVAGMADGMTSLRANGIAKALGGETTLDEVARVTGATEF
jgi:general secretion pathway protein E